MKIDKKVLRELKKHENLENNLKVYGVEMMNVNYAYSCVVFAFQYYTLCEMLEDTKDKDKDHEAYTMTLHQIVKEALIDSCDEGKTQELKNRIDDLRNQITKKMSILTAHVDRFQIYEYILNRIEYGVLNKEEDVDIVDLCSRTFQYIFQGRDNVVINSKIQMVMAQLPVRMTKNRFYDVLSSSVSIYNGAEQSSLKSFADLILTTAGLDVPDGFEDDFSNLLEIEELLENTDYKSLDADQYTMTVNRLHEATDYLNAVVSDYMQMMETINYLYSLILAMPYIKDEEKEVMDAKALIMIIHKSCFGGGLLADMEKADELLIGLEGKQEELIMELNDFEGVLFETMSEHKDLIEQLELVDMFNGMSASEKLHSNSLFVDLSASDNEEEVVDLEFIAEIKNFLVEKFDLAFAGANRYKKRAIMAAVLGQLPVFFNSQKEISEYINYSLCNCNNNSELTACSKIIEDMILDY